MRISREEVAYVARLARLELSPEEEARMTGQLDALLGYVAKLEELDTKGVATTTHVLAMRNVLRDDISGESLPRERALAGGPSQDGENFLVPRVLS
ncbi:MAG: asparaginyl/glutamyl-tRNA amidotransferase subunit C [Desulfobulbaceae bacterium A2]|nr:MAG: asparaginyl/glutamyl-tRNA amidotransferase subunit C [Desulfobulbaceae bacterium A2]